MLQFKKSKTLVVTKFSIATVKVILEIDCEFWSVGINNMGR